MFGSYPITVRGQQEDLAQVLEQLKSESIGSRKKRLGDQVNYDIPPYGAAGHSAKIRLRTRPAAARLESS